MPPEEEPRKHEEQHEEPRAVFAAILKNMAIKLAETTLEAANERQKSWREWVRQALEGGASKAHKYVKSRKLGCQ